MYWSLPFIYGFLSLLTLARPALPTERTYLPSLGLSRLQIRRFVLSCWIIWIKQQNSKPNELNFWCFFSTFICSVIMFRSPNDEAISIIPATSSIFPKTRISHSNQCSRSFKVINKITGDNCAAICMVPSISAEIVLSGFEICCPDY